MKKQLCILAAALAVVAVAPAANAETLKFAHVYEVSEPYHKNAVWAADEIKKRTNGSPRRPSTPAWSPGE
jgi:TRAP-type C4-dicarboxylate transport system substrate-binding protein